MDKQYRISMRMIRRSRSPFPFGTVPQSPASVFSRSKPRFILRCAALAICLFAFSTLLNPLGYSQDKKQKPKTKPTVTKQKKETKQKKKSETKQKAKPKTTSIEKLVTKDALGKLWHFHSKGNAPMANTWQVVPQNGGEAFMLKCTGTPHGYLRTKKQYENYVLEMEFRYPGTNKDCNSGILLHCNLPDKIWPGSIQIQLHYPKLGHIFEIAPAKTDNKVTNNFPNPPLNKWIKLKIESKDGAITLHIDGKKHGAISGCEPAKGFIALQSEGYEIHFRNITIKELPATKPAKKKLKQ